MSLASDSRTIRLPRSRVESVKAYKGDPRDPDGKVTGWKSLYLTRGNLRGVLDPLAQQRDRRHFPPVLNPRPAQATYFLRRCAVSMSKHPRGGCDLEGYPGEAYGRTWNARRCGRPVVIMGPELEPYAESST